MEVIPTLRMITAPYEQVALKAARLARLLEEIGDARLEAACLDGASRTGGGALPLLEIPTRRVGVRVAGWSANALEARLREHTPPVIGRIEEDRFLMDPRTMADDELSVVAGAFRALLQRGDA